MSTQYFDVDKEMAWYRTEDYTGQLIKRQRKIRETGTPYPPRQRRSNMRPVVQVDKNGNEVARYDCISDGARAVDVMPAQLFDMLAGRQKTAGGYKWRYADA